MTLKSFGAPNPDPAIHTPGGIYGGVLFFYKVATLQVSGIVAKDMKLQSASFINGGVASVMNARDSRFTSSSTTNASLTVSYSAVLQYEYAVRGGVFYFQESSNVRILNTFTVNVQLLCSSAALRCLVFGNVLFAHIATNTIFSGSSTQNLGSRCNSVSCQVLGGVSFISKSSNNAVLALSASHTFLVCSGAANRAAGVLSVVDEAASTLTSGISSTNASIACKGLACRCSGGLVYIYTMVLSPPTQITAVTCLNAQNVLSVVQSSGVLVACSGENCFVLVGIAYFEEVFCPTVMNVQSFDSSVSSNETNSKASGAVFAVGASN